MRGYIVCFGILLPLVTLGVEISSRGCADLFFDPIPTPWHILLIALVPLANGLVLLESLGKPSAQRVWLARFNGVALGISFVYTLMFLPILPMAFLALIFLVGLFPLSPLLSFAAACVGRKLIQEQADSAGERRLPLAPLWAGVGVLLLLVVELPDALPRVSLAMATSERPSMQAMGLDLLRRHADPDELWELCTRRKTTMSLTGVAMQFFSSTRMEERHRVFYRATGFALGDYAPAAARPQARRRGSALGFNTDERRDRADDGRSWGQRAWLQLASSQMDATVDAATSVSYLEWTLLFKNTSGSQEEAQAQILLPPGGVVSRLTLWVDGEPREAAFSGTGEVRAAYEAVVRRRQDPVLVTYDGGDRVRMQCFPVPPHDGRMKIRIGITAPLTWRDADRAALRLPCFLERNFAIEKTTRHQVWVEGKQPLTSAQSALKVEQIEQGRSGLRGPLTDEELSDPTASVLVAESKPASVAWARDPRGKEQVIVQEMRAERTAALQQAVLVVDASVGMTAHVDAIAQVVARAPKSLRLLVAAEQVHDLTSQVQATTPDAWERLRDRLRDLCAGGQDNIPALEQAWDQAAETPGSAVVWIHAGQPQVIQPVESLHQRFRRRPHAVRFFEVGVAGKRNRVLEGLRDVTAVQSLPRLDSLQGDLQHLLARMAGDVRTWQTVRRQLAEKEAPPAGAVEGTAHLARLWARDEVTRHMENAGERSRAEAVQLAARYQLVTLVTGAVVLETQEQYKQAGLKPIDPATAPQDFEPGGGGVKFGSAPEPEVWLLVIVAGGALAWVLYRRRRPCATA